MCLRHMQRRALSDHTSVGVWVSRSQDRGWQGSAGLVLVAFSTCPFGQRRRTWLGDGNAGSPPAPILRGLPAHGAAFYLRLYSAETPSTTRSPVILPGHGLSLFILAHSGEFCCQFIPTYVIGDSGWQGLCQAEHLLRQSLYQREVQRG